MTHGTDIVSAEKQYKEFKTWIQRQPVTTELGKMNCGPAVTGADIARVLISEVGLTPKLLECDRRSVIQAALTCLRYGLEPNSVNGYAYLIPYGKTCQLIVGYKGLMELAWRSGSLAKPPEARLVYEKDEFTYLTGDRTTLKHVPTRAKDRGEVIAAYAVARFKGSDDANVEVMWIEDLNAIRDGAAAQSGPWKKYPGEMYRKTVMRRLCKWIPFSSDLTKMAALDAQADVGSQNLEFADEVAALPAMGPGGIIDVQATPQTVDDLVPDLVPGVPPPDAETGKKTGRRGTAKKATTAAAAAAGPPADPEGHRTHPEAQKQVEALKEDDKLKMAEQLDETYGPPQGPMSEQPVDAPIAEPAPEPAPDPNQELLAMTDKRDKEAARLIAKVQALPNEKRQAVLMALEIADIREIAKWRMKAMADVSEAILRA